MVQGSYPRYRDEEKEHLLKADEEAQFEVVEVNSDDDDGKDPTPTPPPEGRCRWARWRKCCRKNGEKKKRPMWRRVLRFFMTIFMFMFVWHAVVKPVFFGFGYFSCRHHHSPVDEVVNIGETPFSKPKLHYDFPDAKSSFFVKQEQKSRVPTKTNVFGNVQFVPSDNDKTSVDFHIKVSDERLWDDVTIEAKKDGLVFSADAFSLVEQFINIPAVVSLSNSDDFKKLYASVRGLDIKFSKDLKNEFDTTRVSTVSGDIFVHGRHKSDCAKFRSASGDIKGSFDLIRGVGAKTVSGDIEIDVHPVELDEKKGFLGTDSVSGDVKVHVVHPLNKRNLKSFHRTTSGDINVRYPEDWQGSLKLTSTSGDLKLIGKNTKIVEKKKGLGGKLWRIIKGDGVSRARIKSVSGDLKVSVGDE